MIHPTSVTNIVDRLEEASLLERSPHPTDRRMTLARITTRGRDLAGRATMAVNGIGFGVECLDDGQLGRVHRPPRAAPGGGGRLRAAICLTANPSA